MSVYDQLKERRMERMRKGQAAATIESIPTDNEIRVALVPLLEGEYDECMKAAAAIDVPENIAGAQVVDREEKRQVVFKAARSTDDFSQHAFPSVEKMMEVIEPPDVNHLYDAYLEMVREYSPKMSMLEPEELDFLSDLFVNFQWSDLSGRQVYALTRFLSTLEPTQLMGKSLGRLSIR